MSHRRPKQRRDDAGDPARESRPFGEPLRGYSRGPRRRHRLAARRSSGSSCSASSSRPAARTSSPTRNFANLFQQGAVVIVLAMGLVFVLLLGEIDLSAGFTAGVCARGPGVAAHPARLAVVRWRSSRRSPPASSSGSLIGLLVASSASRRSS